MKRTVCALLLLVGLSMMAVSCTDEPNEIKRESTAEVPTWPEEASSTANIINGGADTTPGFGPIIPIN